MCRVELARYPKEKIMPVSISPFLRHALHLDALVSGAAAIVLMGGSSLLSPWLGIPSALMFWAGAVLVPFVALLLLTARREAVARIAVIDIIAISALWVAASFGLLLSGAIEPTGLGIAFVSVQALAVALFAVLEFIGLRRSAPASA
jgi:hypothetical protein